MDSRLKTAKDVNGTFPARALCVLEMDGWMDGGIVSI